LPVGTFIFNCKQKSLRDLTASYKRASSPGNPEGHIQLALREISSNPFLRGAHTILVNASATANLLAFAESIIATLGACPMLNAIPVLLE